MTYQEELLISQKYGRRYSWRDTHLLWAMWLEEINKNPNTLEITGTNKQGELMIQWKGHLLGAWNRQNMCLHIGQSLTWSWNTKKLIAYSGSRESYHIIKQRPMTLLELVDWLQYDIWQP